MARPAAARHRAAVVEVELLLQALLSAGKLSTLWQHMDADRSGTLDEDELQHLLALMGMGNGNAAAISADVLDEIDEDGDGDEDAGEDKYGGRDEDMCDDRDEDEVEKPDSDNGGGADEDACEAQYRLG